MDAQPQGRARRRPQFLVERPRRGRFFRTLPGPMAQLILFNKPYGVICQFSASGTSPTLKDFLPQRDIYPAGRLDADSEGLVVLTADGVLQHRITDPRHKLPKTYLPKSRACQPLPRCTNCVPA